MWAVIETIAKDFPAHDITMVVGDARGADFYAAELADFYHFHLIRRPAYWNVHGRAAGILRNKEMLRIFQALDADEKLVVAFSDDLERSKGTNHMVSAAAEEGFNVRVYRSDWSGDEER